MDSHIRTRTVLIVDDEASVRKVIGRFLNSRGFEIVEAATVAEARARLGESLPQAIILDILMPDDNGFSLLTELRNNEKTRTVPVVMVSGVDPDSEVVKVMADSYNGFIRKPFKLDELLDKLEAHLHFGQVMLRLKQQENTKTPAAAADV